MKAELAVGGQRKCFFCDQIVNFGAGRYEGRQLTGYNVFACNLCYKANWDGWAPHYELRLLQQLEAGFVEPKRNANGFLAREVSD